MKKINKYKKGKRNLELKARHSKELYFNLCIDQNIFSNGYLSHSNQLLEWDKGSKVFMPTTA